jgi:hypothetical protein
LHELRELIWECLMNVKYTVFHLKWKPPQQHAAAANELPGNESVTKQHKSHHMLVGG